MRFVEAPPPASLGADERADVDGPHEERAAVVGERILRVLDDTVAATDAPIAAVVIGAESVTGIVRFALPTSVRTIAPPPTPTVKP